MNAKVTEIKFTNFGLFVSSLRKNRNFNLIFSLYLLLLGATGIVYPLFHDEYFENILLVLLGIYAMINGIMKHPIMK